ncbi:PAAR domain-containing protein [Pantoea sp. FN0307]|uniref:PAAR domain-containing protein n=1 Tax=Pantoea sp. FN0307 TaxID=3418560 RepID=UPI003CE8B471
MSEFNAAREQDEIAHTASEGWLIAGAIGGALVAAAAIAVTGGAALVAVSAVAAGACTGGGLGELLGSMSWAPRHVTGQLASGSSDVYINNRPAIRAHLSTGACDEHSGSPQRVAEGSIKVFINSYPAARIGDRLTCSAEIFSGSPDVFIGGGMIQTDEISPEIPDWINWAMLGIGGAALAVLASPAIAVLGTLGGMGGGYAGSYLGGELFGEGSDGQKWMMLAGSLVGGAAGGKGGMKFDTWHQNRLIKTNGVPVSEETFKNIQMLPKGTKPLPETYLPKSYINKHAKEFESGASRLVARKDYDKYGLGKPDEWSSEFVSSKRSMDSIINDSGGISELMSNRLGIPAEQFENGNLLRVEFYPTENYQPKIPSGNEFGARDTEPLWLPGGKLPNGDWEAVISTKDMVKGVDYEVFDFKTGGVYE